MKTKLFALFAIAWIVISCNLPLFTTETHQPAIESQSPAETTPSPTSSTTSTPITQVPSSQVGMGTGPWWILASMDKIWAVNNDGWGLTTVVEESFVNINSLSALIAPSGGHLAYIHVSDPTTFTGLELKLLSLPDGNIQTIAPLTSPSTEPSAGSTPGDPALEAIRAITEPVSMDWSADGTQLAFVGAMDGPAADVYVYRLEDGSITRLTHNTANAIHPLWSPDGTHIVFTTALGFGTGAGHPIEGIWIVDVTSGEVSALPFASTNGMPEIIGWLSQDTILMDTWVISCGNSRLITYNITTSDTPTLWQDCYDPDSFGFDPASGVIAMGIPSDLSSYNSDHTTGVLLINGHTGQRKWLNNGEDFSVSFSPVNQEFLAAGDTQVQVITPGGEVVDTLPVPEDFYPFTGRKRPILSEGGQYWAIAGSHFALSAPVGAWAGSTVGNSVAQIFADDIYQISWIPNQADLLLDTALGIYFASTPGLVPELVSTTNELNNTYLAGWMMP